MNFEQDNVQFDGTDAFDDPLLDSQMEIEVEVDQPFGSLGRRRWLLMAVVVLGGSAAVITMKLLTGGPTAAVANPVADRSMDGFLQAESQAMRVTLADYSSFSHLLDTDIGRWQVPLRNLRGNPFRAFDSASVMSPGSGHAHSAMDAASQTLQRRLDSMTVSMVIRGTVTVALVDGMRMSIGRSVRTEDGFEARLITVGDHDLEVELTEPTTQAVVRGTVPIAPRDAKP